MSPELPPEGVEVDTVTFLVTLRATVLAAIASYMMRFA
jgi:hypothetical protein